jgi:hypothetical protein
MSYTVSRNPDYIQKQYGVSPDLIGYDQTNGLIQQVISNKGTSQVLGYDRKGNLGFDLISGYGQKAELGEAMSNIGFRPAALSDPKAAEFLYQKYPDTYKDLVSKNLIPEAARVQPPSASNPTPLPPVTPMAKLAPILGDSQYMGEVPAGLQYVSGSKAVEAQRENVIVTPETNNAAAAKLADALKITPTTPPPTAVPSPNAALKIDPEIARTPLASILTPPTAQDRAELSKPDQAIFGSITNADIALTKAKANDAQYQEAMKDYQKAQNTNIQIGYSALKANSEIEAANKGSASAFSLSDTDVKALQTGGVKDADKLQAQIDAATQAVKVANSKPSSYVDLTQGGSLPPMRADMGIMVPTKGGLGMESVDMNGDISKFIPANIVTLPDPTNPFKVEVKPGIVPVSLPPLKEVTISAPTVKPVDKPTGNPLLDFGKGFAAPFENLVTGVGDLATGQQHAAKTEVEGDLFASAINAAKDVSTGQKVTITDDLAKIGQNILDNPAYAVGNIAASAIMWLGPGEASKAIRGASETIKAIQGSSKVLGAAEEAARAAGVEAKGMQPLNIVQKGSEIIETPLRQGPLGITYVNKPISIVPKVTGLSKVAQIPGTDKLIGIPSKIGFEAPMVAGKKLSLPIPNSVNAYDILGEGGSSIGYYAPKADKLAIYTEPKTAEQFGNVVKQGLKGPESITYFDEASGEVTGLDLGARVKDLANPTKDLAAKTADRLVVSEATGLKKIDVPSFTSQLTKAEGNALTKAANIDPIKAVKDLFNASTEARGGVDKFGRIVEANGMVRKTGEITMGDVYTFSAKESAKAAQNAAKRADQIAGAKSALEDTLSATSKKAKPFDFAPSSNADKPLETISKIQSTDEILESARQTARNTDALMKSATEAAKTSDRLFGLGGGAALFGVKSTLGFGGRTGTERNPTDSSNVADDYGLQFFPTPKDGMGGAVKSFLDSFSKSQSGSNSGLGNMPKSPIGLFTQPNIDIKNLPDFGFGNGLRNTPSEKTGLDTGSKDLLDIFNIPTQMPRTTPRTTPSTTTTTTTTTVNVLTIEPPTMEPPTRIRDKSPPRMPLRMARDNPFFPAKNASNGKLKKGLTVWKIYNPLTMRWE